MLDVEFFEYLNDVEFESEAKNNKITLYKNALSLSFYIHTSTYTIQNYKNVSYEHIRQKIKLRDTTRTKHKQDSKLSEMNFPHTTTQNSNLEERPSKQWDHE